jgi:glycosyltransferase involved in cell wall biosynthesis
MATQMTQPSRLRRPIFLYSGNLVGGAEQLFLRRAAAAARLGLDPVIITVPGPMDEPYKRVAKVIHVDAPLLNLPAVTPGMAAAVADDIVALLGRQAAHIEATCVPDTYFASLLASRLPESDYSLLIIRPGTSLSRAWPRWQDFFVRPRSFRRALRGQADNGVLAKLSACGRILSVNQACADDAARLAGLKDINAASEPVILDPPLSFDTPSGGDPYLLSVSRIDGDMKSYVLGLARQFAELLREYPGLRLKYVGEGPGLPALRRLIEELGISRSVDFLGTLSPSQLAPLYAGASAFVGMGTAACEAAMYGAPVVIALGYEPACLSPGFFGQPGLEGFGEVVPGQAKDSVADLLRLLLSDPAERSRIAARGQAKALADHHPDAAVERLRALLSHPSKPPVSHPWPLPKWRHLLANYLSGRALRRPLARWA